MNTAIPTQFWVEAVPLGNDSKPAVVALRDGKWYWTPVKGTPTNWVAIGEWYPIYNGFFVEGGVSTVGEAIQTALEFLLGKRND